MLQDVLKIVSNNTFDSIYLTGFVDNEDGGVAQFYPDMHFIYFEFGNKLLEIYKCDVLNQPSQLRIMVVDALRHDIDLEDVTYGTSKINDIIFINPLANNKIKKMYYFNYRADKGVMFCDALHIILCNGQNIFLDPGFMGINIGGLDVKEIWKDNLITEKVPEAICIEVV